MSENILENATENVLSNILSTDFYGPHFVECFLVKRGIFVARARIDVPIV